MEIFRQLRTLAGKGTLEKLHPWQDVPAMKYLNNIAS